MSPALARAVYASLLRLHPEPFRARFRDEMLDVYDCAASSYGAMWLIADATLSLGRQWVLRPQHAAEIPAASPGLISGVYLDTRPPHLTCGKLSLALVLSLLSFFLFPQREPIGTHHQEVHHGHTQQP